MTKEEFTYWQSRVENSRFQWTEDEIFRLNGKGAFYYKGGEDGIYMKIKKDGLLEAGTYEGAYPHIGEASFFVKVTQQYADYNEAFKAATNAGGKQFLVDMFSQDVIPPPALTPPAKKSSVVEKIKEAKQTPGASGNKEQPVNKKDRGRD